MRVIYPQLQRRQEVAENVSFGFLPVAPQATVITLPRAEPRLWLCAGDAGAAAAAPSSAPAAAD